ncbi:uncharacterized protein LOC132263111 [Phlebotomus argentipes]|uniref:uncharacterized protein LOC132263111 n=1 Tax=Phlebotomus argentipes TaxID=94469 RepID=UPI002892B5FA|nr:uncharacterized protein LOC132263111 [Phlebotomus argentipes]XP_059618676.1 uncharacterized protein LOC132263111 [Phlebotomus argentipes]XP_059618677.1 uncharacterized protein LOC132263111 [Phlebotomus argentipes]XP_059618678.1 uncharacterized protein LOC132263111 [Phlebotomus argentipes]
MMNMKRYPSQGKVNSSSSVACEVLQERRPPIPQQRTSLRRYANDWTSCTPVDIYENLRTDGEYCEIEVNGENIYENICDKCGRIYSGDQCECTKPAPKSKKFVDFFGSLKRRPKSAEPRRKKLEIIHNVDGFDSVFSTKDTFDLAEICQLREESRHTYGRIQTTHYENVSEVSPNSSSDEVRDSSLAAWMISLRWEVVDYTDNCAINVKSVPSKLDDLQPYQLQVSSECWREFACAEEEDFTQHILIFIESVSEKCRRRRRVTSEEVLKSEVSEEKSLEVVQSSRISSFNPFDFLNRIFLSIGINTALLDFNNELIVFCLQTPTWRQNCGKRVSECDSGLVMQILDKEDNLLNRGKCLNTDMSTEKSFSPQPDTNNFNTLPGKRPPTDAQDFNIKCESEKIYHPIWKFHTVGIGREAVEALEYNSEDFVEEIDSGEWEIAEEFEFSSSRECLAVEEVEETDETSPFRTICILFNREQPHLNRFIHNYKRHRHVFEQPINSTNQRHQCETVGDIKNPAEGASVRNFSIPDSVMAWKFMLLNANYPEDEEDVILSPSSFEALSQSQSNTGSPMESLKAMGGKSVDFLRGRSKEDENVMMSGTYKFSLGHFSNSVNNLSTLSTDSQKSSSSASSTHSPNLEAKKLPKILNPLAKAISPPVSIRLKKEEKSKIVFGPNLNDILLDPNEQIPKFVVRCIKCIEDYENITTNGIYRASGNKNLIEAVRKKMNEKHHIRKDLIWTFLEKQDVHTLTGSLKLFFRNLTTQLIPDDVFDRLPQPLDENAVPSIRAEILSLPDISRKTLKFLIQHLVKVTQHCRENFMNSANLSICWGACIFASSQKALMTFDTNDVIRKNYLIKLLIEKYDSIFDQIR